MNERAFAHVWLRTPAVLLALSCMLAVVELPPAAAQTTAGHHALPDSMPGDRLLVSHRTADGFELHTVNYDASERTVLTGESDFAGTWSPDGRHVAFHRVERPTDGLWVVARDGTGPRRLADRGYTPSWAPDSTRLVYSDSTEASPAPLRIATLDGSTTPIPGTEGGIDPVWSPDGTTIAFVRQQDHALVLVAPDGSSGTVSPGPVSEPRWAPDSDHVAYLQRGDGRIHLMVMDSVGSERYRITGFAHIQQLAFSPRGDRVAFAARRSAGGSLDIWTVSISDGAVQQLTSTGDDDFSPSWTASSETIMFSRSISLAVDVWVTPAYGGPARRVTDTGADHALEFAPGLTVRLAGERNRIDTAVELSRTFPAASAVVITRADAYPDALAGAPLAGLLDAPLLLTGRDGLHPTVRAELARLGVESAYVLGGEAALSQQVEQDLAAAGVETVRRLAGRSRFDTAARIADEIAVLRPDALDRVFIVEGHHREPDRGWPDAVSASSLAAATGEPILLVVHNGIPEATSSSLAELEMERAVIVGGTAAVSHNTEARLRHYVATERVAGTDRYETSTEVADLAVAAGADAAYPWLATGRNWPDGLAAAPAAARDGGVLLLVDGASPTGSAHTHAWLPGRSPQRGVVVGGTSAVRPSVRAAIESSLASGP